MSRVSTNIHNVTRISLRRVAHGDFVSHQFCFTQADGSEIEVSAFAGSSLLLDTEGEPATEVAAAEGRQP